jgi:hypothetical protein
MKKFLLLFACAFIACAANAQQPFAFVNSDRTQILTVTEGGIPKVILESKAIGTLQEIRTSHLAVLASTRDGKSLLVAGVFHFFNLNDDSKDSLQGFIRLDSPYALVGRVSLDKKTIGGKKVLHEISFTLEDPSYIEVRKPLPLGVLTPNEQEWYGTWAKNGSAPNSFQFFHGKFDGSGAVKVGTLPDGDPLLPTNEYHMTNICADNEMMICAIVDQLNSDDQQRAKLWRWNPSWNQPQVSDLNGIEGLRINQNLDSSFVCLLRIVPDQPNKTAEIGLTPEDEGDIDFYTFRYDGANIALGSPSGRKIRWDVLPDSLYFFTGITNEPSGPGDDRETQGRNMRHVNGGDMMFSQTGDSVVFVTSNAVTPNNSADWYASPERSGIWIYDIAAQWPQAKLVYNNPLKMERQPIFMGYTPKIIPPPPQGSITISVDTLQFDSVIVGKTKSLTLTISNPSENTVNGVAVGLPSNDAFIITSTIPDSLTAGQQVTVTAAFNPSAVGEVIASVITMYANGDSSKTFYLRGIGKQETGGAVRPDDLSGFNVSIHPNPFSGSANVDIQFDGREGLEVRLVDVLGRSYDLNASRNMSFDKNASEQIMIDRSQLKLAPGSYTLYVKNGERTISRQLILVSE